MNIKFFCLVVLLTVANMLAPHKHHPLPGNLNKKGQLFESSNIVMEAESGAVSASQVGAVSASQVGYDSGKMY